MKNCIPVIFFITFAFSQISFASVLSNNLSVVIDESLSYSINQNSQYEKGYPEIAFSGGFTNLFGGKSDGDKELILKKVLYAYKYFVETSRISEEGVFENSGEIYYRLKGYPNAGHIHYEGASAIFFCYNAHLHKFIFFDINDHRNKSGIHNQHKSSEQDETIRHYLSDEADISLEDWTETIGSARVDQDDFYSYFSKYAMAIETIENVDTAYSEELVRVKRYVKSLEQEVVDTIELFRAEEEFTLDMIADSFIEDSLPKNEDYLKLSDSDVRTVHEYLRKYVYKIAYHLETKIEMEAIQYEMGLLEPKQDIKKLDKEDRKLTRKLLDSINKSQFLMDWDYLESEKWESLHDMYVDLLRKGSSVDQYFHSPSSVLRETIIRKMKGYDYVLEEKMKELVKFITLSQNKYDYLYREEISKIKKVIYQDRALASLFGKVLEGIPIQKDLSKIETFETPGVVERTSFDSEQMRAQNNLEKIVVIKEQIDFLQLLKEKSIDWGFDYPYKYKKFSDFLENNPESLDQILQFVTEMHIDWSKELERYIEEKRSSIKKLADFQREVLGIFGEKILLYAQKQSSIIHNVLLHSSRFRKEVILNSEAYDEIGSVLKERAKLSHDSGGGIHGSNIMAAKFILNFLEKDNFKVVTKGPDTLVKKFENILKDYETLILNIRANFESLPEFDPAEFKIVYLRTLNEFSHKTMMLLQSINAMNDYFKSESLVANRIVSFYLEYKQLAENIQWEDDHFFDDAPAAYKKTYEIEQNKSNYMNSVLGNFLEDSSAILLFMEEVPMKGKEASKMKYTYGFDSLFTSFFDYYEYLKDEEDDSELILIKIEELRMLMKEILEDLADLSFDILTVDEDQKAAYEKSQLIAESRKLRYVDLLNRIENDSIVEEKKFFLQEAVEKLSGEKMMAKSDLKVEGWQILHYEFKTPEEVDVLYREFYQDYSMKFDPMEANSISFLLDGQMYNLKQMLDDNLFVKLKVHGYFRDDGVSFPTLITHVQREYFQDLESKNKNLWKALQPMRNNKVHFHLRIFDVSTLEDILDDLGAIHDTRILSKFNQNFKMTFILTDDIKNTEKKNRYDEAFEKFNDILGDRISYIAEDTHYSQYILDGLSKDKEGFKNVFHFPNANAFEAATFFSKLKERTIDDDLYFVNTSRVFRLNLILLFLGDYYKEYDPTNNAVDENFKIALKFSIKNFLKKSPNKIYLYNSKAAIKDLKNFTNETDITETTLVNYMLKLIKIYIGKEFPTDHTFLRSA